MPKKFIYPLPATNNMTIMTYRSEKQVSPVIKEIKRFFRSENPGFSIFKGATEGGNTHYIIIPKEPLKVKPGKYDRFYDLLINMGFDLIYNTYDVLIDCPNYKYLNWTEVYENTDGTEVNIEYDEEELGGKSKIYIKRIQVKKVSPFNNRVEGNDN
jgi:hypothetical protein